MEAGWRAMSSAGRNIVVEMDGPRLSAIAADVKGERVSLKAWHTAECPESVNAADEGDLLAWAVRQLKDWDLGRGRVVCSVPRAEIVLKRLHLSGAGEANGAEQSSIVSLQMSRQLSLSMREPAIDFVPIGVAEDSSLDVLAGALPGGRLEWLKSLARGASLRLHRVGLRSEGVATLVTSSAPDQAGAVLGIGLGASTTDFVIVEAGEIRFARAADIGLSRDADEADSFAGRISVEAKRTWMSYRMTSDSSEVQRVLVLGSGDASREVADRCAEALELNADVVGLPGFLDVDANLAEQDRLLALPLVGLLAQEILGVQTLNFASPRRPEDRSAMRRRRVLLGVLGLIVLAGVGYFLAQGSLQSLDRRRSKLAGERSALLQDYMEILRRDARASHAEQFIDAGPDWIGHLGWLSEAMPDPHDAIADQLRAWTTPTVTFTPRTGSNSRSVSYVGGRWSHDQPVSIVIDGQMRRRDIADTLRDRLLASGMYTVDTRGPDDEDSFSFLLTSEVAAPAPASAEGEP
jgi:Tfp pilus assembly PilM family ATPase